MNYLQEIFVQVAGDYPVVQGLAGGGVIAVLNMLGALSVLVWRNPSERALDAFPEARSNAGRFFQNR